MFIHGDIKEDDLNDPHVLKTKMLSMLNNGISIVVDHRSTILDQAEIFVSQLRYEYAKVFFATYFEHSINSIISTQLSKNRISEKSKNELIKSISLPAKYTWLLELLGLPKFNETYRKTIASTADARNAFLHYKFTPEPDTDKIPNLDRENKRNISEIENIRKAVRYTKSYEAKITYRKNKRRLTSALNKLA